MPYGPENRLVRHRGYGPFMDVTFVSDPWDISNALFLQSFSVAAQDGIPLDVFFKPDGLKMYVVGSTNDRVYEYDLGTAWNVSTAVFLQFFSVAVQDPTPVGLFFRADGLKMYVVGSSNDRVYEYNLGAAWDISTAVFFQFFSVTVQEASPQAVFFRSDGLKMYVVGISSDRVHEYDLGVAWDISTAVFLQNFLVSAQDTNPQGLFSKPDGLKMYVSGTTNGRVYEYDLGAAWNVSTAVFLQFKSVTPQDTSPQGIFFKPDGTKMYMVGLTNDRVYEYNV